VQLLDPPSDSSLDIIKEDNPLNVRGRCKCVLQKWLDKNPDASWNQLIEALRSPCVELDYLADQIEHKLNKTSKNIICVNGFANRTFFAYPIRLYTYWHDHVYLFDSCGWYSIRIDYTIKGIGSIIM